MTETERERKRILLVDDSEWTRRAYGYLIEQMGHSVTSTGSAEEAIKVLGEEEFNGAVSDGLKGDWEKVGQAAKEKSVPLVVTSLDDIRAAVESEGVVFVAKVGGDIEKAIEEMLRRKES